MSTSRYLNWSRPSPARHHPLRKQMSCIESFSGGGSTGRSLSVSNLSTVGAGGGADFATFVTAAIIHTNRFQQQSYQDPPKATLSRRPASATTSSARHASTSSATTMAKRLNNKVLTKQLSLDHHSPAAGHAWTTAAPATASRTALSTGAGLSAGQEVGQGHQNNPKSCVVKKRPPGLSVKNDAEPNEHTKKVLKQAKDSRINIKIFLGQTVQQQDSSDNGVSDTECSVIQREPATVPNLPQQQQQGNQKAEVENSDTATGMARNRHLHGQGHENGQKHGHEHGQESGQRHGLEHGHGNDQEQATT
ncbi:conserved hypothetical protein [Culex quinquefasciatus]|uniref:Uncharacterized protein n=1 Tax=Culex quinquefasciatus TaxID=7176 RepID=B0X5T6_CULQU|nr:conserved hypothetical protein [Culex quinquefasciatus]|eukprot:XP_001865008.1 conserved hypothetical protein [Culex quinquefasciatus]